MKPKDLYFAQILRNQGKNYMPLILRICKNPELFDITPSRLFRHLTEWTVSNIFEENIFTVENWMEVSFHLCKQRWDSSMDWLEEQPMSKIKMMIEINKKFAEQQEDEMKKARRKKK